jgi:hypothetical protein
MDKITAEATELAALLGEEWTTEGKLGQSIVHRDKIISVSMFGGAVSYRRGGEHRRSLFASSNTPADLVEWVQQLASVADPRDSAAADVRLISLDDPEGIAGVEAQRAAEYGTVPLVARATLEPMEGDTVTEWVVQLGEERPSRVWNWTDSRYSPHDSLTAGQQHLAWMATHHGTDATRFRLLVRVTSETVIAEVTL